MSFMQDCAAVARRTGQATVLGGALALGTAATPAHALTMMINFVNTTTTDMWGVTTTPYNFATWGFTGLDFNGIMQATLATALEDYWDYPTVSENPLSPLPDGFRLNVNFEVTNGLHAPTNGDSEYFFVNIGDANPNQSFLGQACLGCVRNAAGIATAAVGTIVGSILPDSIAALLSLATNDTQRMNLLAGTTAHEMGHTFTLPHPPGQAANPGESLWSIMATGASPSNMPNGERIKNRDFAYAEFATLIQTIGIVPVPEPGTYATMILGLALLGLRLRTLRRG